MKLAIIIGRFQPLHLGHISLITEARAKADKTLILVGSSKQLPDYKNPFSYEERLGFLEFIKDDDVVIRPLPDVPSDDEWVSNVIGEALALEEDPTETTIFTNPKDEEFYRNNFVFPVETVDSLSISATNIRAAWYTNTLWTVESHLTEEICVFLENHEDKDRLTKEWDTVEHYAGLKEQGHPFENPIEPVSFAVIIQGKKVLVGKRGGVRGYGQLGLPGGYVEKDETTLDACMRETEEEMGIDLKNLIIENNAQCLAQTVEENLRDLGTRTLGINYLFVIRPDVELDIQVDTVETLDYAWLSLSDILEDKELLFYNHNLIVKRLCSKLGESK